MSHRLNKLNERLAATRHTLGWFGVAAAFTVLAAVSICARAESPAQDGLMLRPGQWTQDDGSYVLPAALDSNPRNWPVDGWYRVTNKGAVLQVSAVATPERGLPAFLQEIAMQQVNPDAVSGRGEMEAEAVDTRYIRVPGARIAEGRVPAVTFLRGALVPRLDHAYELSLDGKPFTLTVQNGLRNKAGVAYGDGALYTVRSGDETYSYHLQGGAGYETRILAAADLDSDGKPDFIVQIGDQEVLLLSSQAKPGRNAPAAVLAMQMGGC
ncbi:MAG: hypothetical protein HYX47_22915 [Burkholderiales bacterium]|nr:hypothetical protein [Burkholderiales bacterium]